MLGILLELYVLQRLCVREKKEKEKKERMGKAPKARFPRLLLVNN